MLENIGTIINEIRKEKKMTLNELANASSLSIAFLSKLERNLTSPTLIQLHKICEALEITFSEVIKLQEGIKTSEEIKEIVVKNTQRKEIITLEDNVIYESLTYGNRNLEGIAITIPAGKIINETSWGHHSDELGVIAEGTLVVQLKDNKYTLSKGDSIYIEAHTPHSLISTGEKCISYWCYVNKK